MSRYAKAVMLAMSILMFLPNASNGASGYTPAPPETSWYIYVTQDEKDKALNTWMYNTGLDHGRHTTQSTSVILDFGQPWKSGEFYGTWSFNPRFGRFLSTSTIEEAVKQYVRGYIVGAPIDRKVDHLWLAVGTNNYGSNTTSEHGKAWAQMMVDIYGWLTASHADQRVILLAASDIELGYSTPKVVASWISGYKKIADAPVLIDYGDAQGCPRRGTTTLNRFHPLRQ
jgi:hypothetical protein